jgi:hypothetical protein
VILSKGQVYPIPNGFLKRPGLDFPHTYLSTNRILGLTNISKFTTLSIIEVLATSALIPRPTNSETHRTTTEDETNIETITNIKGIPKINAVAIANP